MSADVKPFVPKFAGLNVGWSDSSEARAFPSCVATPYYPCVQELAVPEYVFFRTSCLNMGTLLLGFNVIRLEMFCSYQVNVSRATREDAPHPRRKCTAQLSCVAHQKLKIQLSFFSSIFIWLFGAEKVWRWHCIYYWGVQVYYAYSLKLHHVLMGDEVAGTSGSEQMGQRKAQINK